MTAPSTIRVAAIDDHPIFLAGLKRALQLTKDIEFVAQGASAADACRIAREERPDVMLLDITMPGDGIQAARDILAADAAMKIVILTASDDDDLALTAISAGVIGFLRKGVLIDELVTALRDVHRGSPYVTPSISSRLLMHRAKMRQTRLAVGKPGSRRVLTFREKQVLALASQGLTNDEIARQLELSAATIKSYMSRIFDTLEVRNRVEAIAQYLQALPSQDAKP